MRGLDLRRHSIAIGLLLLLFARLATSAAVKSPTFDEPLHVVCGYVDLATRDWRMQEEHPPLIHLLTGPLLFLLPNRPDPRSLVGWDPFVYLKLAKEVFLSFRASPDKLIFPSRVIVMGLTMLLGATLYRWAAERHGPFGGLLGLFVYVFSPNILAHGRLVTTDLALTCFFFLAVRAFGRLVEHPTLGRLIVAGLFLGLAMGSKVSGLLLIPALALLALLWSGGVEAKGWRRPRGIRAWLRRLIICTACLILTVLLALLVLWAMYGFETGSWAEGWPALPLPHYLKAVFYVRSHDARGHPAFLMGERSDSGWRHYFLIALALKTPLPTIFGAPAGTAWILWKRRWWLACETLIPPLVFFMAALVSSLNIGYRHILPIVPFLILMIAGLADLPWRRPVVALLGCGMAVWLVMGTLGIYPDYLAYFNELAGGPEGGRRYLTDSNLDWGQDLKRLGEYLREHSIEWVYLSYFGNVDPAAYGIRYRPLPSHFPLGPTTEDFTPFVPPPGFYAISVTNLSGQYLVENPSILDWFNHHNPVATIGHSIDIYEIVPDPHPPNWVGMCLAPGVAIDDTSFARGAGRDDLRFIHFDCRTAWVFPEGEHPGWVVIPTTEETQELTPSAGSWRLVFEQQNYDGKRLFTIHRWDLNGTLERFLTTLSAQTATAPPYPVRAADVLELLAFDLDESTVCPGQTVRVTTFWRVLVPPSRPLSLMAHLADTEGQPVAVGDSLGFPVSDWRSGDIFAQTHLLRLSPDTAGGSYTLLTGVYWWPEIEHLPLTDGRGQRLSTAVIPLTEVEVRR